MSSDIVQLAYDRQQALRHEASQSRSVIQTNESSLRKRLATVATVVRSALPGVDGGQGSVFPSTH